MDIVDRTSGLLIAMEYFRHYSPTQITGLKHWSDMAFLAWTDPAADLGESEGDLRYVLRWTITNKDTINVANQVVANYQKENQIFGGKRILKWPGITFKADSEEAQALLETPNGSGVAWLLIQHKR